MAVESARKGLEQEGWLWRSEKGQKSGQDCGVHCGAFDLLSLGEAHVGEEYFGSAVLIKEIGSISGAEDKPR